jgi:hypothetical protein
MNPIPYCIFFFPNGMCAVCDLNDKQIAEYQGTHAESLEKLKKAGYNWTDIPVVYGRPNLSTFPDKIR